MTEMNEKKFACTFPDCKSKVELERAQVPAVAGIRAAIGRPVTVSDLSAHVLCGRHAHMARKEGVPTFSYVGTASLLERREAERETARNHFLQLRAKTQMGRAIAKAFNPKDAGSGRPTSQPQS